MAGIIAEADVGKATFYRYFHDKYGVMNSNYKELLDEFMSLEDCSSYRDLLYAMMPETLSRCWAR